MVMFRLNLYIPLLLVTLLMLMLIVFMIVFTQEQSLYQNKENRSQQFVEILNKQVVEEAAVLTEYLEFIEGIDSVTQDFSKGNKKDLHNSISPTYKRLNKNVGLTHLYFIRRDGTVLLRVHDYQRDNDTIDRTTFTRAREHQRINYGLEFGPKKNYTLRVVKPWFVDGELIGYIELGKEIDKIINEASKLLKTHIYLAISKDIYNNVPQFIKERLSHKVATKNFYIVYSTHKVPVDIHNFLDKNISDKDIYFENHYYFISKHILSDVSGRDLGYFVFLNDVSSEYNIMYSSIKILSAILGFVSIFLLVGGYFVIRKKEQDIHTLTSTLHKQKEDLGLFNSKLQKIFDLQKNIVILSSGDKLIMANQAMYDFFGYKNLDAFLRDYHCICDNFIQDDNFFHLKKLDSDASWVKTLITLPEEKRIVAILDYHNIPHIFSVSVSEYDRESYVVTFSDISNTMLEYGRLKRKVIHDTLTSAFNREFFQNNIYLIIRNISPKKLGVVLCDIDDFKVVNDTYGHNRGDLVLKEFTNIIQGSIRSDDYLIRWGGEEFIILIGVDDIDVLKKISESIRKLIEIYDFDEVGKMTASFGLTLSRDDEDIVEMIERVDKALYLAKEQGKNQIQVK